MSIASLLSINQIAPIKNPSLENSIDAHQDNLTKPKGSLGVLELCAKQLLLIAAKSSVNLETIHIVTFAGDHGIVAEKITPFPPEVTPQMVYNMANGGAAVSVMCKEAGISYAVIDVGVNHDFANSPGIIHKKIRFGTRNFLKEPAMTTEECERAIRCGFEYVVKHKADGIGVGEMGIGNSASASAMYSLLLGIDPKQTVGPGSGASASLLEHKRQVVKRSVETHKQTWDGSAFECLRRLGGFEIAAMVGAIIGCAHVRKPVVIDGFISSAAALCAIKDSPSVIDYCFFSHESKEPFHREFLSTFGVRPLLNLDMRLGEGTGAVLAFHILKQALVCYNSMATFTSASVSAAQN